MDINGDEVSDFTESEESIAML
ncbi:uncharacterized protein G2W53_012541 [Senna tora]|uniref:Uncharacterized protein n=1 Tax=Senna tora TaxID=362788 RepID=A0A834WQP9_9FABA|nr:uncharacterized protein G2W53_012541 [Senna tora]